MYIWWVKNLHCAIHPKHIQYNSAFDQFYKERAKHVDLKTYLVLWTYGISATPTGHAAVKPTDFALIEGKSPAEITPDFDITLSWPHNSAPVSTSYNFSLLHCLSVFFTSSGGMEVIFVPLFTVCFHTGASTVDLASCCQRTSKQHLIVSQASPFPRSHFIWGPTDGREVEKGTNFALGS